MRYRRILEIITVLLLLACGSRVLAAEPDSYDDKLLADQTSGSGDMLDPADKEPTSDGSWWGMADWSPKKKVAALNVATIGTIAGIGVAAWDYGSHSFRTANEGWFDADTPYGGADKLGHVFTCYALGTVYSHIYTDWGYSENDAILLGATNSLLTMTVVEFADGLSKSHGFSWQDEVMNAAGAGFAYLRHRFPAIRERVDLRWEWFPSPAAREGERFDVLTDYSGQKFLLAFKLDGWLRTGNPVLKALELQTGYYTRGYVSGDDEFFRSKHRYGYIGIGLNVTYLLERLTGHRAAGVFDYYQVPYTYLSTREDFN